MFSAIKYKGFPLYYYARNGITIDRNPRKIFVKKITLTYYDGKYFSIHVLCSKGTYIRSLIADIGKKLGVGAHMTQLHRVYIDTFIRCKMIEFSDLYNKNILQLSILLVSIEQIFFHFPIYKITTNEILNLKYKEYVTNELQNDFTYRNIRLYNEHEQFIGIGVMDIINGNIFYSHLL